MKLRLSEAIRLGSMLRRQAFGDYTDSRGRGACAWGAANLARGLPVDYEDIPDEWMALCHADAACPQCGIRLGVCDQNDELHAARVAETIVHLNDDHRWSRPQIADWVATIEQSLESQVSRVLSPGEEEEEPCRVGTAPASLIVGNTRGSDR